MRFGLKCLYTDSVNFACRFSITEQLNSWKKTSMCRVVKPNLT